MPKVVTQRCLDQDLNPRPTDCKPKCLTVAPPRHRSNNKLCNIVVKDGINQLHNINETSGYTTWFTAGDAIHIAHYDVIDDVITRKL